MFNPKASYPETTPAHVAFLGLGVMGGPMARHLLAAGHFVTVYNRDITKAQAWVDAVKLQEDAITAARAQNAITPAQAAQGADIVFCCVSNDAALREVTLGTSNRSNPTQRGTDGAFTSLKAGAVFVDHSTTSVAVVQELAQEAVARQIAFIDAPVSGGELGAKNGLLTVMCGGQAQAFAKAEPLIASFAKAVTWMGQSGSGQLTKMVNQICIAGLLQALSEAIAFGEKADLDMERVLSVISQGAAQSWQMQHRGPTMLLDQFDFGFAVDLMRKDLGLVLHQGQQLGASLPITAMVDQLYAQVQSMGGGRWDTSSLIKRLR